MERPDHWDVRWAETYADVQDMLAWLRSLDGAVAIDTETTGLKWWTPRFVRMIQFAAGDTAWCITPEWWGVPCQQAMQIVVDKKIPVVFHNAKFDLHALESDGYAVPEWWCVHDTKIMDHLLIPHENHSLKPMCARRFGRWAEAGQYQLKQAMAENGWDWATIPVDHPLYVSYGGIDTLLTWHAFEEMKHQMDPAMRQVYEREQVTQEVMYGAETRGMRIDTNWAEQLRYDWNREAVILADQLRAAGIENPRSNKQLEEHLKQLGWEPDEFTPKGAVKLDKVILEQLSTIYPDVAPQVMRFKRITKWSTVYLDRFLNDHDHHNRVHPGINTLQARTGRMSITEPPLQTLPAKGSGGLIRRCIIPSPGRVLYAIDYQSQEAREFAHYSRDVGMIEAITRGDDIYAFMASRVLGREVTKVDPIRDRFKTVVLAFLYGAGVSTLAKHSNMPEAEVEVWLTRLFTEFPGVRELTGDHSIGGTYPGGPALSAKQRRHEEGLGYILTHGGRRFSTPSEDEDYKHVNGLMQGSGADVLKRACWRLRACGLDQYLVVPVHDEGLFDVPNEDHAEIAIEIARQMEDREGWTVPLTVDIEGPLQHWGSAYEEAA